MAPQPVPDQRDRSGEGGLRFGLPRGATGRGPWPYPCSPWGRHPLVLGSVKPCCRVGKRVPFWRGRPIGPGRRAGAGASRAASRRTRVPTVTASRTAGKYAKAASLLSATTTSRRGGSQRFTSRSLWRARSVRGRCLRPCCWCYRSEGHRAVRTGKAHTRPAHGIGTRTSRRNHRRPRALTKWEGEDRPGSRERPVAVSRSPRRRSRWSAKPLTRTPVGANAVPTLSSKSRLAATLDHTARLRTR
jgi:hypothetical protein